MCRNSTSFFWKFNIYININSIASHVLPNYFIDREKNSEKEEKDFKDKTIRWKTCSYNNEGIEVFDWETLKDNTEILVDVLDVLIDYAPVKYRQENQDILALWQSMLLCRVRLDNANNLKILLYPKVYYNLIWQDLQIFKTIFFNPVNWNGTI